jgi:hypothetical protein
MPEEKPKQKRAPRPKQITPLMAEGAASGTTESTRVRRNITSQIESVNRFANINDGLIPFKNSSSMSSSSSVSVRDAVVLCQKAYYNFSTFRNIIDLMTEFSTGELHFKGGTKKTRQFFEAFFKKIGLRQFQDKWFREYYRSGNVFIYRFESKLRKQDVRKITQVFGGGSDPDTGYTDLVLTNPPRSSKKLSGPPGVKNLVVPARYLVLNPADIQMEGSASFAKGKYSKAMTDYELERLRKPYTEEDEEILRNLDSDTKQKIKDARVSSLLLPLDPEKMIVVFYKKQDYEPFAVPMGFPVLDDINLKAEMKKMDAAILRTMQQAILLVTMGAEPDKGGINQKNLLAMQKLFENESVGRVLISDYTTKAEFVVPKIADLLDPRKYEVVERDINVGLNNILFSGETFSNQSGKVDVFIARLNHGRQSFIEEFLLPEIKRIAKALGFRSYPTPHFNKVLLKEASQMGRLWNQLAQYGLLTPEEVVQAHETGRLPSPEESEESQKKYKSAKDAGLYEPVTGGPHTQLEMADRQIEGQIEVTDKTGENQLKLADKTAKTQEKIADKKQDQPGNGAPPPPGIREPVGRPPGTSTPQSTKNVSPRGQGEQSKMAAKYFSIDKIKDNLILAGKLYKEIEKILRKKHSIKRLNKLQKESAEALTELIVSNESSEAWLEKAELYCDKPNISVNKDVFNEVLEISGEHQVDNYLASILRASRTKG